MRAREPPAQQRLVGDRRRSSADSGRLRGSPGRTPGWRRRPAVAIAWPDAGAQTNWIVSVALRRLPRLAADLVLPPTCPGCRSAVADAHALVRPLLVGDPLHRAAALPGLRNALHLRARRGHRLGRGAGRSAAVPPRALGRDLWRRRASAGASAEIPRPAGSGAGDGGVHAPRGACSPRRLYADRARPALPLAALAAPLQPGGAAWRRACRGSPACRTIRLSLQRVKPTRQQVGLDRRAARRRMCAAPSACPRRCGCDRRGAPLLLVDDVYTSGATAKAATRALLRAGAEAVDVLTFARVTSLRPHFAERR